MKNITSLFDFGFHFVKFGILDSPNCNEIIIFTKNIAISSQNLIDLQKLVVIRFISTIHRFLQKKNQSIPIDRHSKDSLFSGFCSLLLFSIRPVNSLVCSYL